MYSVHLTFNLACFMTWLMGMGRQQQFLLFGLISIFLTCLMKWLWILISSQLTISMEKVWNFFLLLLKLIFDEKVNKMKKVCCYLMPLAFCLIILILNTTVMCAPALLLCFFQNEIWLLVCVLWKLCKYSQQFFFF